MKKVVIGILAHVDAGKTTLSERILYLTGKIRKMGRVDTGDTYLDTDEQERARGITIFSKQAVFPLGDFSVSLLDTPGHVDFSAEMERTLQVLDYAVLVISGADGVQGHTDTLWRLLKRYKIPCFLFINKMDQEGTEKETLLAELQQRLDGGCLDFTAKQEELWENLAMCEERLLEMYLEQGNIERTEILRLIRDRKIFPCYFGSALKGDGVEKFLAGLESLLEEPKAKTELGAKVYKISRDNQGNRLTHMKITGGCLKVKGLLPGREDEKINQIRIYSGEKFEAVKEAEPGTICAVTGPVATYPGQGIGVEKESELPILEPVLNYQVILPEGSDIAGMISRLKQLEEEEPQLHIAWNEPLKEIHVQVMGEIQIEILKNQIRERFGREVEFGVGNIVYKETVLRAVEGVGHFEPLRHYAEVHLLLEPAEPGSGLQVASCCSEDTLDKNWQRLILTHLEEKIHKGVLVGADITDMKITLLSGRAHVKHTEGGDFRQATYRAVRQGLREAGCRLLEPWFAFRLEVPAESVGRVMSDLEQMQGSFEPPQIEGEKAVLKGSVPAVNMQGYQQEVTRYTRGRGKLHCTLKGYEPCHNEEEVVENAGYDPEADLDNPTGSVFCAHGAGFVVPWNQVKNYMHLAPSFQADKTGEEGSGEKEGGMAGKGTGGKSILKPGAGAETYKDGRGGLPFGAEEKELEEIFIRTYGETKKKQRGTEGPRRVIYEGHQESGQKAAKPEDRGSPMVSAPDYRQEGKKAVNRDEYLLVDGYNIIFGWEELRELAKETIDGARYQLMDTLCNYQAFRQCVLIVVFDAYKVAGNTGSVMNYHNIHVVYTKEAETADQYIEKFAYRMGRNSRVTVATSDGLEQVIIRGAGCLLMSAEELWEDVKRTGQLIREEQQKLSQKKKFRLFDGADEKLKKQLEDLR